jgi:hypothetical protein
VTFLLDEAEARDGFPTHMLRDRQGRFVAPRMWFGAAAANQWLLRIHLGTADELDAASLQRLAKLLGNEAADESGSNRLVDDRIGKLADFLDVDRYLVARL